MTPSNPDNSKPFIYRICDALGITHLVVAVQHSHLMSEITGLVDALAAKQDTLTFDTTPTAYSNNPVTSSGVYSAINNKMAISRDSLDSVVGIHEVHTAQDEEFDEAYIIGDDRIMLGLGYNASNKKIYIDMANVGNLERALADPDSTPTESSDNLVTSGGVAAALAGKMNTMTVDQTPSTSPSHANNLISSYAVGNALGSYVKFNAGGKFTFEGSKLTPVVTDDFIFGGFHVDASSLEYTCPMALHITKIVNGSSVMMFSTLGSMFLKMSADLKEFDIFILVGDKFFRNHGFTNVDQQGYLHFDHWAESASFPLVGSFFE